jgi:uncharacterized protein (DUF2141 family)
MLKATKSMKIAFCLLFCFGITILASSFSIIPQQKGTLTVTVGNIRTIKGEVGLLLFNSEKGFPSDPGKAIMKGFIKVNAHSIAYSFTNVSPGTYAVAVFHDENNDQKVNTNFLGIPKEGVGVSNNAKGFLGPPKFEDAKFTFSGNRQVIKIDLEYL